MSGIGHNGGPSVENGAAWRTHCWRAARAELLPVLPIEVVRLRVRRAAELGLDYKTYAGVRAATGQDVVGLLFSTNALALLRHADRLDAERATKLAAVQGADRIVATLPPLSPEIVAAALAEAGVTIQSIGRGPTLREGWAGTRSAIQSLLAPLKRASDMVLLIGDTTLEREWSDAARLAGFLPAARYFGADAQSR